MIIFNKLICRLNGHKRAKRLKPQDPPHVPGDQSVTRFQCPRCSAVWTRKAKPLKQKPEPVTS